MLVRVRLDRVVLRVFLAIVFEFDSHFVGDSAFGAIPCVNGLSGLGMSYDLTAPGTFPVSTASIAASSIWEKS